MIDKLREFSYRWPLLYVHIELPFIRIQTALWYYRLENQTLEYVMLKCHIYKWHFEISLFDTQQRRLSRHER